MSFLAEVSGAPLTDSLPPSWIFDRIEEWAGKFPKRFALALDQQEKVEEYSYREVLNYADAVANLLEENGAGAGDRVGILMENVPQWVFVLLGTMRVGAIAVPLATTLPETSLQIVAEHAGCKVVFADEANWEKARHLAERLNCAVLASPSGRGRSAGEDGATGEGRRQAPSLEASPWRARASRPVGEGSTALIIYTSGTTGNPKGVELSYHNLNHEIRGAIEILELSPNHRILSVLPFSHVLPLIANALGPLGVGAGVVFLSSISPQRITDAFHRHRITFFICVPQFFYILHKRIFSQVDAQPLPMRLLFRTVRSIAKRVQNPRVRRKLFSRVHKAIGPELQLLASGGSRFDPKVAEDFSELGYTVLQAYGLTETAAAATITPVKGNTIGTVGTAIRGVTIRIDSPNEEGIGEVCVRGPIVMKGYYRAPDLTADAIKDGWFHTGDLGFIRDDKNLVITGRSKDVIVLSSGKKAYPEELEMHYSQSPFIKEICIMGLTEKTNGPEGEVLHAIIVPEMDEFRRRGQTGIREMVRFDLENLSRMMPSYYRIHSFSIRNDPFPRTVTRKLKRFEIQKEELARRSAPRESAPKGKDHSRFNDRVGSVIAALVHESKPEAGALDPSMSLELDLGFDSLARVELLGLVETKLEIHLDEEQAARTYTLGELIDALENTSASNALSGQTWKEILDVNPADPANRHYIVAPRPILNPVMFALMRSLQVLSKFGFHLRYNGIENLPPTLPFILCPNHESFLDGPLLISTLPRKVIYNIFILGYTDYWQNAFSRQLAQICNIVAIDPNANLIRAMQLGAVGLKNNRVLLIFPEGTRSIDGRIADFKKGAAILSYELGVPIVPLGIRGTFESWPRGGSFRFHPVEFHFGKAIDPRAFNQAADPYGAITDKLREDVKILADDR